MDKTSVHQSKLLKETANKGNLLLRLIRAAQPISRTEIAKRSALTKVRSRKTSNRFWKTAFCTKKLCRKKIRDDERRVVVCVRPGLFYRRESRRSAYAGWFEQICAATFWKKRNFKRRPTRKQL